MAQKNTKKPKMTNAQRDAKMKAAEERQKRAEAKKAAKERTRKIFTWVIVIILVIGLTIPVAGISAGSCMSHDAAQTASTASEQVESGAAAAATTQDASSASAAESSSSN